MQTVLAPREPKRKISGMDLAGSAPFLLIHVSCLAAFMVGWDARALALCAIFFFVRKFGITGGYHRYFSHRSYKMGRVTQFIIAWLGTMATQKGPLWWAAHHRHHHRYSDTDQDIHSPTRDGFWWAHMGWIMSGRYDETNFNAIPDFARYPELRWLNKYHMVPPLALAVFCYLVGGITGLVWGYSVSTVMLWHTTFFINSACHLFGKQRFPSNDTSRNSLILALVTMGEGWHNNHHYYQASVGQGFYWWEIDMTKYILKFLSWIGLVWDLRSPPQEVLDLGRRLDAARG